MYKGFGKNLWKGKQIKTLEIEYLKNIINYLDKHPFKKEILVEPTGYVGWDDNMDAVVFFQYENDLKFTEKKKLEIQNEISRRCYGSKI